jgi:hypothetical protein
MKKENNKRSIEKLSHFFVQSVINGGQSVMHHSIKMIGFVPGVERRGFMSNF